jgi:hypothetical protein
VISLHVQLPITTIVSVFSAPEAVHPFPTRYVEWMNGLDQTVGLSHSWIRLFASDPTSTPSVSLSNRFLVFASFATSSSLKLEFRCCEDRLNPQKELTFASDVSAETL